MSLKDSAGLVKMYAFVDVNQYQIVGTGNTVDAAREDYISKLKTENVTEVPNEEPVTVKGVIEKINSAVLEGNTTYFIKLQGDDTVYIVNIKLSDMLPFAESGTSVTFHLKGNSVTKIEYQ